MSGDHEPIDNFDFSVEFTDQNAELIALEALKRGLSPKAFLNLVVARLLEHESFITQGAEGPFYRETDAEGKQRMVKVEFLVVDPNQ